jgi:hypothetical protein
MNRELGHRANSAVFYFAKATTTVAVSPYSRNLPIWPSASVKAWTHYPRLNSEFPRRSAAQVRWR